MIHVADLVRLIVAIAREPGLGAEVRSAADDRPQGYTWEELLGAAARAVGNPTPRFVRAPSALLSGVALVGDLAKAFGSSSMISSQKLRELRHPDWCVAPAERAHRAGLDGRSSISSAASPTRWPGIERPAGSRPSRRATGRGR